MNERLLQSFHVHPHHVARVVLLLDPVGTDLRVGLVACDVRTQLLFVCAPVLFKRLLCFGDVLTDRLGFDLAQRESLHKISFLVSRQPSKSTSLNQVSSLPAEQTEHFNDSIES